MVAVGGGGGWGVVGGGRPLVTTEASSRAQILARCRGSSPLPRPQGPLKDTLVWGTLLT